MPSNAGTLYAVACSPGGLCFAVGEDTSSHGLVLIDGGDALTTLVGGPLTPAEPREGATRRSEAAVGADASTGEPVDTATGDFYFSSTDLSTPTYGPALNFTRNYDSLSSQSEATASSPGALGYGWTETRPASLEINEPSSGDVTVVAPNGSQVVFVPPSGGSCPGDYVGPGTTGTYCALPRVTSSLTYNSSTSSYTLVIHPNVTWIFDSSGRLTSVVDASGDADTLSYNTPSPGSGNCPSGAASCEKVTAASGRQLTIGWSASSDTGVVASVTDSIGRKWTYGYDSHTNLTSVTDPLGHVTSYSYDTSNSNTALRHDILTVTKPNAQSGGADAGDVLTNTYDSSGRVATQTDPMGRETTFDYSGIDSDGVGTVAVTDPNGNENTYRFNGNVLVQKTMAFNGSLPSTTEYVVDDVQPCSQTR